MDCEAATEADRARLPRHRHPVTYGLRLARFHGCEERLAMSFGQIGKAMGISKQAAQELYLRAMAKVRQGFYKELFEQKKNNTR
jgi:hypothetical protein